MQKDLDGGEMKPAGRGLATSKGKETPVPPGT